MTNSKKEQRQALNRFLRGQAKETKRERDVGINVRSSAARTESGNMPPTVRATFGRMRMATTKMWPIKDSVARVIAYADNPQKTAAGLSTALRYATDEAKTEATMEEKRLFITALNCNGYPTEAMLRVQQHFGKAGGNVAYHAYQSFKPGEMILTFLPEI